MEKQTRNGLIYVRTPMIKKVIIGDKKNYSRLTMIASGIMMPCSARIVLIVLPER